jgi:dihydroorotate dehydrogenase (fumarate)
MSNLTTTYLGLKLKNPLVASSSPLTGNLESIQELEKAGIAAVVLPSLFEEEIIHESQELDHYLSDSENISAESPSHWPVIESFLLKPEVYIEKLTRVKKAVSIPVIGSLNGVSTGGWTKYARKMEEAGADAVELNLYYLPVSPDLTSAELEETYINLVHDICKSIKIPVAVKLSPFFTALPNVARRFVEAGAWGLVLFNRFYQPDIDIESLEVVPNLVLSTSAELRLPLRWIAILYGKVKADLALTSGVHTGAEVIKSALAGASVVMMTSELLHNGANRIPIILSEVETWMVEHEYESYHQVLGSLSQKSIPEPAAYERANYIKALKSFKKLP